MLEELEIKVVLVVVVGGVVVVAVVLEKVWLWWGKEEGGAAFKLLQAVTLDRDGPEVLLVSKQELV